MSEKPAVNIEHVSKYFAPSSGQQSIKQAFVSIFKKKDHKRAEGYWALRDIDFSIKKGEFFGIVGRNGSGKSTLLKMIAGVYNPTQGRVELDGKLVPFIELGVGFSPELSGRDNLYLNGAILGFSRTEMSEMYDEIVSFAELGEHMDVKLKNFSSGMQVRLAFAIAIRAKADILLIDEVLAVGDMAFQEKCFDYFSQIKGSGKTVIFVSHDMGSVERFCDRAALIEGSKLISIGDTKDITLEYGALMHGENYRESQSDDITHKGTGSITVERVKLRSLLKGSVLKFGEELNLSIEYKAIENLENVVLGIAIKHQESGVVIMGPNTKESGIAIPKVVKGRGSFGVEISNNNLAPGVYTITVGVFSEDLTTAYDYVDDIKKFKITGVQRNGHVYSEPKWSI